MQGPCVFGTGCRGARLLAWLILNDRVQPSLIAGVLVYLYVPYLTGRGVFTRGLCGVTGSRRGLSRKTAARQPSRYIQYNTIQYNTIQCIYKAHISPVSADDGIYWFQHTVHTVYIPVFADE